MSLMPATDERQPIPDTGSLADHEAAYQPRRGEKPIPIPEGQDEEPASAIAVPGLEPPALVPEGDVSSSEAAPTGRDDSGRFKPRHRAKSQQARAEDVPRIKELTRKLKEAEDALTALKSQPAPAPVVVAPPATTEAPRSMPTGSTPAGADKFTFLPYDQYLQTHPQATYEDWNDAKLDARDAWRDDRIKADRLKQEETQRTHSQQQAELARRHGYAQKEQAFAAAHADYETVKQRLAGVQRDPPLLLEAVLTHDNGPAIVYYLAQHPEQYHEMRVIAAGKPVNDDDVASMRRILDARMQAGATGAAAPLDPVKRAPKPPTPVRTGPMQTGTSPPSEGASLADHEAFYHQKRRR